ncbi:class D sortase [Radiobacillus sp. PE A8.2]|uniref:class D sortase n=1 Tax=Radiobacillus sp. PE A8.2 TaxID=3380349 RepID=UPI00388E2CC3
MKKLAIIFILAGIGLLGVGGYQFVKTYAAEKNSLLEAKQLLEKSDYSAGDKEVLDVPEFRPGFGETVGILEIPKIDAELPIVEGTDPDDLDKGVGHYTGTAYPRENDQIVLSGHRNTVFRKLGDVEIGDTFVVRLPHGEFIYEMVASKIVEADDRTVIQSTAPEEILTITTCYPFGYLGNAPQRYIITAKPVEAAS